MKKIGLLSMFLMLLTVTSCELVGDIFSAGFYTGLFLVVGIAVVIIWLFARRR
ncbi:MAG TPA: hypothetical protein VD927_11590 [Chryseosolibacter sp.]|nr:hypothetical protein [Chryseosolibacter sp.]